MRHDPVIRGSSDRAVVCEGACSFPRPTHRSRRAALRKLRQVDAACRLEDLRIHPGNRLEHLRGDRAGQYSIRINDQWRICFKWGDAGPEGVEIVDYH